MLGSEGGSYYATERALTRENAASVLACLAEGGERAVARIVAVSEGGPAPTRARARRPPVAQRRRQDELVELIHFLFGGNADKDSIFRSHELASPGPSRPASMSAATGSDVARSGRKPSRIRLQGEPRLGRSASLDAKAGDPSSPTNSGARFWVPCSSAEHRDQDEERSRFSPTFRSLFSYFARRQNSGGLRDSDPAVEQAAAVGPAGRRLLPARPRRSYPQEFQEVRTQEKAMAELRKAAKEGGLGRYFGPLLTSAPASPSPRPECAAAAEQVAPSTSFPNMPNSSAKLRPSPGDISGLNDETVNRELIPSVQDAFASEQPPAVPTWTGSIRKAGVVLPGTVGRRSRRSQQFTRQSSRTGARIWPQKSKQPRRALPTRP